MTKLFELSRKYNFRVDSKSLIVPATIETDDMAWLIDAGYRLTFEVSPLAYVWCDRFIKQNKIGGVK